VPGLLIDIEEGSGIEDASGINNGNRKQCSPIYTFSFKCNPKIPAE
jgi:hypothetical protein